MKFNEENISVELDREGVQEVVAKELSTDENEIKPEELNSLSDKTLADTYSKMSSDKPEGLSIKEKISAIQESLGEYDVLVERVMEELNVKLCEAEEILEYYGF